jgi:hypothetical protein
MMFAMFPVTLGGHREKHKGQDKKDKGLDKANKYF